MFVVKRVLSFIEIVPLFTVPVGRRHHLIIAGWRVDSFLWLLLYWRFIELSSWFASAFGNVLDRFNASLFASHFIAKVNWLSWVVNGSLVSVGFENFTIVWVGLLGLCFNSNRVIKRAIIGSRGFWHMLKLAVARLLILRTGWIWFQNWIILYNLLWRLVSRAKSLFQQLKTATCFNYVCLTVLLLLGSHHLLLAIVIRRVTATLWRLKMIIAFLLTVAHLVTTRISGLDPELAVVVYRTETLILAEVVSEIGADI